MEAGCDGGLCLSQKLSQVSLRSRPHLDQILCSFAEDDLDDICSQDFFCTPDFLTPVEHQFSLDLEVNKENVGSIPPIKCSPIRSKRPRPDSAMSQHQPIILMKDSALEDSHDISCSEPEPPSKAQPLAEQLPPNSRARIANMRRRVLSPPCVKNPFKREHYEHCQSEGKIPPKQAQFLPALGANCESRYREEFHEIEEIGQGNFSSVFKVLKRIDGCLYAVKRSHRQLRQDSERRQALTEVQALAALGLHEHIVRYHTAWFENDQLYIQMELCEGILSNKKPASTGTQEKFLLEALRQVAEALAFIHSRGLAHLDIKPANIYFSGSKLKLGDFGRATRLDGSISVEEGDARYMPLELINDDYRHLPKADVFALGATIFELARNLPLPSSGSQFQALRQGKLPLLPGFSLPFQHLLKALMHPNPEARPSPQDLLNCALLRKLGTVVASN
ncbi:hypothetical protein L7F22_000780 [Adiantum nelumboides]|nr:hypothetical protein [Adiantum nelumboides]